MRWSQRMVCGLVVLAVAMLCAATSSATTRWNGIGDWTDDASNWDGGLPHAGNSGNIQSGTAAIDTDTAVVDNLYFSDSGGSGTAGNSTLNMSGGTLTGNWANFYGVNSATQIWNLSGGDATFTQTMHLMYGHWLGTNSSSILNMTGGTLSLAGDIVLGGTGVQTGSPTAHIQLDGGILSGTSLHAGPGGGTPTMDITRGTLILDGNLSSLPDFVTAFGSTEKLVFSYDSGVDRTTITAVPEPSACVLLGIGVLCLGLVARRRRE